MYVQCGTFKKTGKRIVKLSRPILFATLEAKWFSEPFGG